MPSPGWRAGPGAAPLLDASLVRERARAARAHGASRFCLVTSGRRAAPGELERIARMLSAVREEGLLPCATLGLLGRQELRMLKGAGLDRYHHNLETSRLFFPRVCTTHTYAEKLRTVEAALAEGLTVCSGGLFGLGEGWDDRVEMALELRRLGVDSVGGAARGEPLQVSAPREGGPGGGGKAPGAGRDGGPAFYGRGGRASYGGLPDGFGQEARGRPQAYRTVRHASFPRREP
ncbi:MAG: radical SAM protein [Nitrospirota bacterium]